MNKKQKSLLAEYERMSAEYLYQIYKSCSGAKMEAYENCRRLQAQIGGYGAKVKKCGSYFFTYAFKYMLDGKEHLCYMTGKSVYRFAIE